MKTEEGVSLSVEVGFEGTPAVVAGRRPAVRRVRQGLLVAVGVVAVGVLTASSFAFLQTSGAGSISVTAGGLTGSNNEFADVSTTALGSTVLNFGVAASWSPVVNQVVGVTTAGDLAEIQVPKSSSANILVTLTVGNEAALSADYSYMNLPVQVFACSTSLSSPALGSCALGDWQPVTEDANGQAIGDSSNISYVTLANGGLTFLLGPGIDASTGKPGTTADPAQYFELAIPKGGSFYTISTTASGGSLAPSYLVTATSA